MSDNFFAVVFTNSRLEPLELDAMNRVSTERNNRISLSLNAKKQNNEHSNPCSHRC